MTDKPEPAAEAMARALHAEHVREFVFMQGDRFSDPVPVEQCGNCQRWGRYAANLPTDVMLAALVERGALTEETDYDCINAGLITHYHQQKRRHVTPWEPTP